MPCALFIAWTLDYGPADGKINYRTKIGRDNYHRCCAKISRKVAEEQGFNSLKFYNKKKKEILSLMFICHGWTTNNRFNKLNKLKKTRIRNMNTIKTT